MAILGTIIKRAYELRSIPIEIRRKKNYKKAQEKVLRKLLTKAQNTAFGEHYDFPRILARQDMVKAFQQSVPTFDYNSMFKNWWYRAINGEGFVSWPGRVKYFALTSGTSESSSKQIPVTGDMIRAIRRVSIRQLVSTARYKFPIEFYEKGILMVGGSTHLNFNGSYYEGDLSGISAGNIPFWFQHFYKPGKRISRERDWETKLEEIIRSAPGWDIGVIVGVPAWIQIILERIIERHKLNNIHDIWPDLAVYVHSGVSFEPYTKSFDKLFGKLVIFNESYLASEGYIAYQSRQDEKVMQLVVDNGLFYEFIPFNGSNFDHEGNMIENPDTKTLDEVEEGQEYALLLSNCAGAWRYLIGDTIKIVSKESYEIVITGRTKHFLSLCGEHLSQENMNMAIKMLQDEFNLEIREFTVAGFRHESMFAHKWYLGTDDDIDPKLAVEKIDEYLKVLNDDYRVERISAVTDVFLEILSPKVFANWMKIQGKEGGANKFPRVLKGEKYVEWEAYLKKYKKEH
jgi:hypothetical protein